MLPLLPLFRNETLERVGFEAARGQPAGRARASAVSRGVGGGPRPRGGGGGGV
jgi:hypothetical protein